MRSSAVIYVKGCLEPLVSQGHYVLVFTATHASLPSFWIMSAYRSLPRPFRKNVQVRGGGHAQLGVPAPACARERPTG